MSNTSLSKELHICSETFGWDITTVYTLMRNALSINNDDPILYIDSNEYWSPKQAIRFISKLEEKFDITWAEEPARRWDYNGLKKVSDNIKAAVATGENINDLIIIFHPSEHPKL